MHHPDLCPALHQILHNSPPQRHGSSAAPSHSTDALMTRNTAFHSRSTAITGCEYPHSLCRPSTSASAASSRTLTPPSAYAPEEPRRKLEKIRLSFAFGCGFGVIGRRRRSCMRGKTCKGYAFTTHAALLQPRIV
ncbi:unnamed protein product [Sphenostylis stenocarpa]|uniref:Uncharacterized protein n=1 Tax=Sphenostylis stenocarpa TaxID=92480 RepID=A0AA86T8I4_9FABA|nr:unnamed protein product [Sphenostylis stenocarpa]